MRSYSPIKKSKTANSDYYHIPKTQTNINRINLNNIIQTVNVTNYYDQKTYSPTRENKFSPEKKRRHPNEQTLDRYSKSANIQSRVFEDQRTLPNIAPTLSPTKKSAKDGFCYFYNETEQKKSIFEQKRPVLTGEKFLHSPETQNIFRKKNREKFAYSNSLPRTLPPGPGLVGKSKFLKGHPALDSSNSNSHRSITGKKKIIDLGAASGKITKSR